MHNEQAKGSWQRFKAMLRKHWVGVTDKDLLEAADHDDKFRRETMQERYRHHNDEAAGWAEDWCERGGWRNHPPAR